MSRVTELPFLHIQIHSVLTGPVGIPFNFLNSAALLICVSCLGPEFRDASSLRLFLSRRRNKP